MSCWLYCLFNLKYCPFTLYRYWNISPSFTVSIDFQWAEKYIPTLTASACLFHALQNTFSNSLKVLFRLGLVYWKHENYLHLMVLIISCVLLGNESKLLVSRLLKKVHPLSLSLSAINFSLFQSCFDENFTGHFVLPGIFSAPSIVIVWKLLMDNVLCGN